MITLFRGALIAVAVLVATPQLASAQKTDIPGFDSALSQLFERIGDRVVFREAVELTQGNMKFYADLVEYHVDTNRMIATGNVLLIEPDHQIAADRADFNPNTRLGTFFNARGFAKLGTPAGMVSAGPIDPDIQFYGETLEKVSNDTYIITNGAFTSCVQANPRWEMASGRLRLRVDHYALLKNMMLKVKGIPALYLPYMYYPLSSEGRSTGFLMPSYGSSTYKGHTISNAFFWAIDRSQDATVLHDWYSKTGQSIAGEYRYISLSGSGNFRSSFLNEQPSTYLFDGDEVFQAGRKSFNAFGNLSQQLGGSWYAQGRADYSSDLTVDQLYSTDISRASRRTRSYGGSVSGTTKGIRVTGIFDRNEYFAENGSSSVRGNNPRINITRPDRLIGRLPVYASVTSEYVRIESRQFSKARVETSNGLHRMDIIPAVRFPFNKIAFLGLNTTVRFPNTFWSESLMIETVNNRRVETRIGAPISRRFVEMSADVNGPTLVRIWDAPNASYAQRFRHSIEPFLSVTYRTAISNFDLIPKLEGSDSTVGNATSYSYGMNTRFYAKRTVDGAQAIPREVIMASLRQTYYSDSRQILNDATQRSKNIEPTSHFSPISVLVRTAPFGHINGNFRTDFDGRYSRFRSFSADAGWEEQRIALMAGWSAARFRPDSLGNNTLRPSQYFNSDLSVRFRNNRYGFIHQVNWDVKSQSLLQHRIASYYNAQCCGFSAEYQFIDLTRIATAAVPQDSRFHFSVTLGGVGNVSNIFGALGGTNQR